MVVSSVALPGQILPSGLVVPPLAYLLGLAVALLAVVGVLLVTRPAVTQSLVAAFAPWMVTGAGLHALYQIEAAPAVLGPLLSAPAVYVTTFILAGAIWAGSSMLDLGTESATARIVAATGIVGALIPVVVALLTGLDRGTVSPLLPAIALVVSTGLTGLVYVLFRRVRPTVTHRAGLVGLLVVFGHTLDGVSTAVGVDFLGTGERSPLPRAIMEFAGQLPTADILGQGWLFVLVKLAIALVVLDLFVDFLEDEPVQGNIALGVVAAVGLGPGAHNLILFATATA